MKPSTLDVYQLREALCILYVRAALRKAKLPDGYESVSYRTIDTLVGMGYVVDNSYRPDYERVDGFLTSKGQREAVNAGAKSLAKVIVNRWSFGEQTKKWSNERCVFFQNTLNELLPKLKCTLSFHPSNYELSIEINGIYAHYMLWRTDEGCKMASRDGVVRSERDLALSITEQTNVWALHFCLERAYKDMLKFIGISEK